MPDGSGDSAQVGGNRRIFAGELVEIAELDIGRHDPRPLGAGAEKPAAPVDQTRGVEGVAGDEELDALSGAQIRPDHHPLALAVAAQQEDLERIAEIIVVELVVADAGVTMK